MTNLFTTTDANQSKRFKSIKGARQYIYRMSAPYSNMLGASMFPILTTDGDYAIDVKSLNAGWIGFVPA